MQLIVCKVTIEEKGTQNAKVAPAFRRVKIAPGSNNASTQQYLWQDIGKRGETIKDEDGEEKVSAAATTIPYYRIGGAASIDVVAGTRYATSEAKAQTDMSLVEGSDPLDMTTAKSLLSNYSEAEQIVNKWYNVWPLPTRRFTVKQKVLGEVMEGGGTGWGWRLRHRLSSEIVDSGNSHLQPVDSPSLRVSESLSQIGTWTTS